METNRTAFVQQRPSNESDPATLQAESGFAACIFTRDDPCNPVISVE
jgi:hypothetical protein